MTRSLVLAVLFTAVAGLAPGQTPPAKPDPAKPEPPKPAVQAELEKALELFKQQKFDDCLAQLTKTGKAYPNLPPAKVQMSQWFLQGGNGRAARAFIEQAIAEDPRHVDPYLLNAGFALNEGRFTDAIMNLSTVLQLAEQPRWDPDQKKRYVREARTLLASCYQARFDFDGAKEHLKGLLNDDPKNGPLRTRLAEVVFRSGKPEEAFDELKKAYTDDPTLDPPELRMAAYWQAQSMGQADPVKNEADRKKAEEFFQKAVSGYPKNAKGHREYAIWLMEDGKVDAAGLYVDSAGKIEPAARDTAAVKALAHLYRKEFAQAEPLLEGIMKDAPGDAFATGYLCLVLAESGDAKKRKRAVELAQTLVNQTQQKAALPYAILGWCLLKDGRVDEADKALGTAASVGQVSFDTAYFMARLLSEQQKYEAAKTLLAGALAAPHGPFVFRPDAKALLAEVAKKVPEKKDEPKK